MDEHREELKLRVRLDRPDSVLADEQPDTCSDGETGLAGDHLPLALEDVQHLVLVAFHPLV